MAYQFRQSLCNEVYQGWDFAQACHSIRSFGFDGIEIAPFTLAEDPATIPAARRREFRSIMESEGLEYVGLHWLMAAPKGLHVTTPDEGLRKRSWDHVRNLADLSADLAGGREEGSVMIFGSPQQRGATGGATREEATRRYADGLAEVAEHAGKRRVKILAEALPSGQCDVLLSLEEAVEIVKRINHPAIQTMFDVHNAVEETEPHDALVRRNFAHIKHIHLNEFDGRHPGTGDYDFVPLLQVLAELNYQGWISTEAFDFSLGAETIATETIRHMNAQIAKVKS
jgi:sugar phosphate isomerase/epimerase